MFEAAEQMMVQMVPLIPAFIGVWLVFDFCGMLFGKN